MVHTRFFLLILVCFISFATTQASLGKQETGQRVYKLTALVEELAAQNNGKLQTVGSNKNTFKLIQLLLAPYKKDIFAKSIFSCSRFYLDSKSNNLFAKLVKEATSKNPDLCWPGAKLAACLCTAEGLQHLEHWHNSRLRCKIKTEVQIVLNQYLQQHSLSYFQSHNTGALCGAIEQVSNNLPQIIDIIFKYMAGICSEIPLAWHQIYKINPTLCFSAILWQAISTAATFKITAASGKILSQANKVSQSRSDNMSDCLKNIETVKTFDGQELERARFEKLCKDYLKANNRLSNFSLFSGSAQGANTTAFRCAMLAYTMKNKPEIESLTDAFNVGFTMTNSLTYGPQFAGWLHETWHSTAEALEKILQPHQIKNHAQAIEQQITRGHIHFDAVEFGYQDDAQAPFKGNFEIKAGEKIGVVGLSGGGKTTLINLILRLFDVNKGKICIDGIDVKIISQSSLHKSISLISQSVELFNRSIMENIRYGNNNASEEQVRAAAKKAGIDEFITSLPQGYETIVGQGGKTLSGGQKQRISIARAFLKDAKILILDEATSALDPVTASIIETSLTKLCEGKTTITITHKPATIQACDKILVIDNGSVVAQGKHEELLLSCNVYKDICQPQQESRQ